MHCLAAGNLVGVELKLYFFLCHLSQAFLTSNFNQCFYYSVVIPPTISSPLRPSLCYHHHPHPPYMQGSMSHSDASCLCIVGDREGRCCSPSVVLVRCYSVQLHLRQKKSLFTCDESFVEFLYGCVHSFLL